VPKPGVAPSNAVGQMREVLRVAAAALEAGELPIAAAVLLGDRVLATAHTAERGQRRRLVHAELLALDAADRLHLPTDDRRRVRIVTNLEPCLMCMGAAMTFGVAEVVYALESPADGAVALVQGWQRAIDDMPGYREPAVIGGVCRSESAGLFAAYAARFGPGRMADFARTLAERASD
jgi:tRNA(adenine34) deaminase